MDDRTPVSSTWIRAIGYDAAAQELEVELLDGDVVTYGQVPQSVATAILSAPSPGAYFNRFVKGFYPEVG